MVFQRAPSATEVEACGSAINIFVRYVTVRPVDGFEAFSIVRVVLSSHLDFPERFF